jgi:dienelactone hydrolase
LKVTASDMDKITCPVLILAGEDDPVTPAAAARQLVSSMRHAAVELRVFAGVGDGVFRQAPAQAFARLRAFLSKDLRDSGAAAFAVLLALARTVTRSLRYGRVRADGHPGVADRK